MPFRDLGDELTRPLDAISRAEVESRFGSITALHGRPAANWTVIHLGEPARRIADRIEALMYTVAPYADADALICLRRQVTGAAVRTSQDGFRYRPCPCETSPHRPRLTFSDHLYICAETCCL